MTPAQKRLVNALLSLHRFISARVAQRVPDYFVEDAVADTIAVTVKVILAGRFVVPEGVSEIRALKPWLMGVIRRLCADTLRREGTQWLVRAEVEDNAIVFDPIPVLEAREVLRRVPIRLSRGEVQILNACAQGASIEEIAATLGIPEGTAATRLRDVRRYLRQRRARER